MSSFIKAMLSAITLLVAATLAMSLVSRHAPSSPTAEELVDEAKESLQSDARQVVKAKVARERIVREFERQVARERDLASRAGDVRQVLGFMLASVRASQDAAFVTVADLQVSRDTVIADLEQKRSELLRLESDLESTKRLIVELRKSAAAAKADISTAEQVLAENRLWLVEAEQNMELAKVREWTNALRSAASVSSILAAGDRPFDRARRAFDESLGAGAPLPGADSRPWTAWMRGERDAEATLLREVGELLDGPSGAPAAPAATPVAAVAAPVR